MRRAFRQEQRGVLLGMAAALAVTLVALVTALTIDAGPPQPFPARLQAALRFDLLVAVSLAAAIGNVARLRFFSEQDIAGSGTDGESAPVRQARAILQNTLEQAALAVPIHLIVAASFPRSIALAGTLAVLFACGRLLFWAGYRRGARARAFGFALTFYPSLIALGGAAALLLAGGGP